MVRVLIADDHEVVRRGLKQMLAEEFRADFGEACDGQAAMDRAIRENWDIVLLDIAMPGRGGLDVLSDLKRLKPNLPVLVLSMFPEAEFAARTLKLGASGYVTKQSLSDELVTAVRKALAGGTYVSASLAEKLAASLSRGAEKLPHEALSNREIQVLRRIAQGKTVKSIAAEMNLSRKTVATYRTRLLQKMKFASDVEIARYALANHLTE
ncbi:MAG: response regulator transcription factor [Elusimicrobia bacterium]|nr:response regulator transcription factor [Elusimicrobiota bacterium]